MGVWEIMVALIGGTWYIVSAISAAKEKKKKQEKRRQALAGEKVDAPAFTAEKPKSPEAPEIKEADTGLRRPTEATASVMETPAIRGAAKGIKTASEKTIRATGAQDAKALKDARKAILQAMRKEMGLPEPSTPKRAAQTTVQPPRPVAPAVTQTAPLPVPSAPQAEPALEPRRRRRASRESSPAQAQPAPRRRVRRRQPVSPSPISGRSLRELLRNRSSLQQAIVLTEVIAKPVSMREDHLRG